MSLEVIDLQFVQSSTLIQDNGVISASFEISNAFQDAKADVKCRAATISANDLSCKSA